MQGRKLAIISTFLLFLIPQLEAQDSKLMASYIYSFTQYVEWPSRYQDGEFIIGIYGESDISGDLEKLIFNRKIKNQQVIIKRFSSPDEITRCHVAVISSKSWDDMERIVDKLKPYNTLIITKNSGCSKRGPGIGLITKDGKLSFELNRTNILSKGMYIDNQINLMATTVF